ncbi:MAG: glycosyltransferase family 2 protein [Nitrospirota bacterium]|nr:glycosyltransferase family 2 protein [Nitrospirota bacterium]
MPPPLVSVIIPVYNGEKYLAEAVESVLAQIYRPLEIIVIDDGSSDRSADVVRGFSETVRYYYQPNSGSGAARNAGVQKARGGFLAFLDADDLWVREKLSLQVPALEADPGMDMVFGHVSQFFSPDLEQTMRKKVACPDGKLPGYHVGTLLIRRETFLSAGLFNPGLQCGEFLDWSFRAKEKGLKELLLPDVLMKRRIHSSNMGIVKRNTRTDNAHADYVRILKASLDRRRNKDSRCRMLDARDEAD